MKKNTSLLVIFLCGILLVGIATLIPQRSVHAQDCGIDTSTKKPIPCPPASGGKPGKKNRPTPVTIIPTFTATSTGTPTITPTFAPTSTYTPLPTTTQPAAQLFVPVKLTLQPNTCDPRIWQGTAGLGFLLASAGILAQALRRRSARRPISQVITGSEYSAESKANTENLDVHIGKVDFGDGSSDQNPNPAGLIAFVTTGVVLVLGSAAGILKLIPCSAWMAAMAGSVLAGLAAAMTDLMFRKKGMGR